MNSVGFKRTGDPENSHCTVAKSNPNDHHYTYELVWMARMFPVDQLNRLTDIKDRCMSIWRRFLVNTDSLSRRQPKMSAIDGLAPI